jgi:hypothetical protein
MHFHFVFTITVEAEDVLVGNEPCTWGPSFWCANRQNAEKCGPEVVNKTTVFK